MAKGQFTAPTTSWKPVLEKRAAETAAQKSGPSVYSELEALERLDKLFEKTATAERVGDKKRCTRQTEEGACGHFKLSADQYCEFHKNPKAFEATGIDDYGFHKHASVGAGIKARLVTLKPSV